MVIIRDKELREAGFLSLNKTNRTITIRRDKLHNIFLWISMMFDTKCQMPKKSLKNIEATAWLNGLYYSGHCCYTTRLSYGTPQTMVIRMCKEHWTLLADTLVSGNARNE